MTKEPAGKIRIKDIAEKASVSIGTVDRVLHNRGEVAEETRQQVLNIIAKLGYTPNLLAKSLALKKLYRIAVLIPEAKNDNPYWEKPRKGIEQALLEIKDFNSTVEINTFKINREDSFIDEFSKIIESKPDGLVLNPYFLDASLQLLKRCDELRIPYIFVDINIESTNNLAYYGQDAFQSGYVAAKLLDRSMVGRDRILILNLTHQKHINHHLIQREKGFLSYFHLHREKITSCEIDLSNEKLIDENLHKALKDAETLKGIFVTSSKVYKVAGFLERHNIRDILLVGYDLIDENIKFLEKGIISFLIGQKPEEQGYNSIMTMFYFLMQNRTANKVNYSPIDIILKENIDYYKNYKS